MWAPICDGNCCPLPYIYLRKLVAPTSEPNYPLTCDVISLRLLLREGLTVFLILLKGK